MHKNLAVILLQFNYGKNSFIVSIPVDGYVAVSLVLTIDIYGIMY